MTTQWGIESGELPSCISPLMWSSSPSRKRVAYPATQTRGMLPENTVYMSSLFSNEYEDWMSFIYLVLWLAGPVIWVWPQFTSWPEVWRCGMVMRKQQWTISTAGTGLRWVLSHLHRKDRNHHWHRVRRGTDGVVQSQLSKFLRARGNYILYGYPDLLSCSFPQCRNTWRSDILS